MSYWQHWKYKNLTYVILGIIAALLLSKIDSFHFFLINLGTFGYLGAFLAGFLFVSTFTVATGVVILVTLANYLHPLEIGLIAGLGGVVGDLIIYKFIQNNLIFELEEVYTRLDHKHHLIKLLHTKYFNWSLPVIGAIIIASPLPDELGVTLIGLTKMKTYQFILISYLLNSIGIFLIITYSVIF